MKGQPRILRRRVEQNRGGIGVCQPVGQDGARPGGRARHDLTQKAPGISGSGGALGRHAAIGAAMPGLALSREIARMGQRRAVERWRKGEIRQISRAAVRIEHG
ncbi:hypothetical protein GCM10023209_25680 [Roseibacterium beibuensis]|uniref:Uncharacterized protein n=1 Tax=[Roseibacterium] beibuensis TaxID=1193142 RepID=A0ABP9LDW2_9RHOB